MKALGYFLIALPFIGVISLGVFTIGLWPTVAIFSVTTGIIVAITIGVMLITQAPNEEINHGT